MEIKKAEPNDPAFLLNKLFIRLAVELFGLLRQCLYYLVPCCHDFGHHQQKQTL